MSQTLSLPPDRYSLFITPPVAGVDFTGTPTPAVSYQWRKNGIAIAGQTAATISGVWVGETGGTVDLVDGDTISIDIILTNPVQVTTKTVSAVIDASIPAPTITALSIRLVSAPTTPVSTIPNASIGSQIMVASAGSVSVVTTPPLLPTYQWRRGFAPIAGATAQTYTLQAADADSIIDCVVTATNSGGTTTRTATATVGTLPAAGWTELTPSADSRLIYVSNDGDDVAASSVKGRGYYLPGDDEIGADPTQPSGQIVAYRTFAAAKAAMRFNRDLTNNPNDPLYPDWMLFRRGDLFTDVARLPEHGTQVGGRSSTERRVYAAWGQSSAPRPILKSPLPPPMVFVYGSRGGSNLAFMSLDMSGGGLFLLNGASNVLVEDCRISSSTINAIQVQGGAPSNVEIRRTTVTGTYSPSAHNHAAFVSCDGDVAFEECVMDHNGFKEDVTDATGWTSSLVATGSAGELAAGTGVQPARTSRDRNLYLNSYSAIRLHGNIFSRDGGGTSVQMREGGIAERNLFVWNEAAASSPHGQSYPSRQKGTLIKDNVVLHDDHLLSFTGWGRGFNAGGAQDDIAVLEGNIVAHLHRYNNGGQSVGLSGKPYFSEAQPAAQLMRGILKDNAVYREFGGAGIMVMGRVHNNGVLEAEITGNAIATGGQLSMQGDTARPQEFVYSGNKFYAANANGLFRWGWYDATSVDNDWRSGTHSEGTFAQWQAAGYDSDATLTSDFDAFKSAVGWTAPERDIVSYMQSVDPTYVVNEDVYVDEDATVKQANRQKVWEVLVNHTAWPGTISETRAKQVARRYHAFLAFIQRAKENRKGAWDPRWTAGAVNNYIRQGFGKAPVTGPYDERSLATRLAEYAS